MHMLRVIVFAQMMVVVRIELHLKLFVGLHQRIDILHRVLHVDIIIRRAVDDEHTAR